MSKIYSYVHNRYLTYILFKPIYQTQESYKTVKLKLLIFAKNCLADH